MQGIRVVEVAGGVAGAWCSRLLAHLGAAVTLVEPPGGSSLRTREPLLPGGESPWHHWLNAGKSSIVADDFATLETIAANAAVVIWTATGDEPPGAVAAVAARLRRANPAQVFVALSAYGLTGPWRSLASSELTEWAAGGHLLLTGDPDREPVQGGGPWPAYFTGTNAAIGAQVALLDAARTNAGQLVDVSAMETMAGSHQWTITSYTHTGYVKRRDGNRLAEFHYPINAFACRDRWIQIAAASNEQFENLCIVADAVELLADDRLGTPAGRYDHAELIDAALKPWLAERGAAEVVAAIQGSRIPAGRVSDLADLVADEQLEARRFWSPVPELGPDAKVPGPPFFVGPRSPAPPVGAPALGPRGSAGNGTAATAAGGTAATAGGAAPAIPPLDLSGLRVLEFSIAWAGPLAGRNLADLGADVIKIEHPTARGLTIVPEALEPDEGAEPWRWGDLPPAAVRNGTWPALEAGQHWWNRMGLFNKLQRNKRSLCLDVKSPGGREVLHDLVRRSDVVLNNYSPRGVQSLGIDHASLSAVNPRVITVSMSGYGATGPMASHFSFGPILETHSGLASTTGYPDGGPLRIGVAFPDPAGGLFGTVAILTALWERERTGTGLEVDLSQLETLLPLIGDHILTTSVTGELPTRWGNRSPRFAPQGVYRCGGPDAWLALTVRDDDDWAAVVDAVGRPALADPRYATVEGRRAHHDAIDAEITAWTSVRGKFEAMAALQARGVPAMAALSAADLVDGPQLQARGFIATVESGEAGPQRMPGASLHFSGRSIPMGAAPNLGEHNRAILGDLLGYGRARIDALAADGTIAWAPPV